IMARALILLRLATGSSVALLDRAGVSDPSTKLRPWWWKSGLTRGLWEPLAAISKGSDTWVDVQTAIGGVRAFCQQPNSANVALCTAGSALPHPFHRLGEAERIGLWGLRL